MLWTAPPPARECHGCGRCSGCHGSEELSMKTITTIGFDIAKSVFQVHGVDAAGEVVIGGRNHAIKKTERAHSAAANVRVVEVRELPEKEDVSYFLSQASLADPVESV